MVHRKRDEDPGCRQRERQHQEVESALGG
jgi:hypothetical protein